MIRKYTFGTPWETGATVRKTETASEPMPYFEISRAGKTISFQIGLSEREIIFGLGESVRGINKRGHRYRAWNLDDPNLVESRENLYGAHNFLVFFRKDRILGLYLDDPGMVTFDLGETHYDRAVITSENGDLDVYLLEAEDLKSIVREFRQLIGPSYLPPRWAFGYIQSRWGYRGEKDISEVVENYRSRHIPLDGVCLDIDYMEDFRNFTWNRKAFPDLRRFNLQLKGRHVRLIPIIDAGIGKREGYAAYESGLEEDAFCRKEDGSLFHAYVWPGDCCFPDFLSRKGRKWFGSQYLPLLETGIEGFWNDMNEPSLFFTKDRMEQYLQNAEEYKKQNPEDFQGLWSRYTGLSEIANHPEDYRSFFHHTEQGTVRHDLVHNLYGAGMTRATAEGIRSYRPDQRYLLFSRSSFIGAHRDGGIWQGDNISWWSHLRLALQMMPGLNMCGFLYTGADLGGFAQNTTEDLLARFLQLGVFMPLMRNHTSIGTRNQEIYRFDSWEKLRDTLTVRYALLPFLYSEFMKAALRDEMLFRPLAFDYPEDERAVRTEDQLMLGEDCMIAPVYEQNAMGRYVYLPEDMLMIRFRSGTDYDLEPVKKGDHYLSFSLHEFPLFVRKNHPVLLCAGGENTEELDDSRFTALAWTEEKACYDLYRDDGLETDPRIEEHLTRITLQGRQGLFRDCPVLDSRN